MKPISCKWSPAFVTRLDVYVQTFSLVRSSRLLCGHVFRLLGTVCHVYLHRLQSAAEADSEPVGYQTETRHIRARIGCWDWPRRRRTSTNLSESVSSNAHTTRWLHKSSPADNTVCQPYCIVLTVIFIRLNLLRPTKVLDFCEKHV
jgi:hypothetical protein